MALLNRRLAGQILTLLGLVGLLLAPLVGDVSWADPSPSGPVPVQAFTDVIEADAAPPDPGAETDGYVWGG